jgi:hypothetical protein
MEYYLSHVDVVDKPIVPILKVCQDSLSVCGGQNTIPVYRCIRYLLSKKNTLFVYKGNTIDQHLNTR